LKKQKPYDQHHLHCYLTINAPKGLVWDALTNPEKVKQYFFGTNLICDWKAGSPIRFKGEWEGKPYEDKGTVLEYQHENQLTYDYYSAFSGQPDVPESYQTITYQVKESNKVTTLTITQNNCRSEEVKTHSESNWKMVMEGMKKLVEGQ
jgi:uncharacterized protein YndB with AHSA1/START domain